MCDHADNNDGLRGGDDLFCSGEDVGSNARMNWAGDPWSVYAFGYRMAAEILVQHVAARPHYLDWLVYPIVFLYRQTIELDLKEVIISGRKLLDWTGSSPVGHGLVVLWTEVRKIIEEIWPNGPSTDLDKAERWINQLAEADGRSDAFRYPTDTRGDPSMPGITLINVRKYGAIMKELDSLLDGVSIEINERLNVSP